MRVRQANNWARWIMFWFVFSCGLQLYATPSSPVQAPTHMQVEIRQHSSGSAMDDIERTSTNIRAFLWINTHHSPPLDAFFLYFHYLGSGWILIPILLIILLKRRELAIPLVIAVIMETLIVMVLKERFQQPRPVLVLGPRETHLLISLYGDSFPSGDAAMAFALAGVMSWYSRRGYKILWILYAIIISYGRVYLGVHFPLDVVTGALIGMFCAVLATRAVRKRMLFLQAQGGDATFPWHGSV